MKTKTELYQEFDSADNALQAELNRLKIDRYTKEAQGQEGSQLNRLYLARKKAFNAWEFVAFKTRA